MKEILLSIVINIKEIILKVFKEIFGFFKNGKIKQ